MTIKEEEEEEEEEKEEEEEEEEKEEEEEEEKEEKNRFNGCKISRVKGECEQCKLARSWLRIFNAC